MKCRRIAAQDQDLIQICDQLNLRSKIDLSQISKTVQEILSEVQDKGDEAVAYYTKEFDRAVLAPADFLVTAAEIEQAMNTVEPELLAVMKKAALNIQTFHEKQIQQGFTMEVQPGSTVGMVVRPLAIAGIYVPGGTAPLPSTVLMNVIPAKAAGVPRVVLCTPPGRDGKIAPIILAAARIAGADEIYKVGGAQAIGAMAYGTATIPQVDKICGPGNIYVNTAKRLVYGQVDIDMFAGPSEILILADESAEPEFIAADMLSQAEHDKLASAILITTSLDLADKVEQALERQWSKLSRRDIIEASLTNYCGILTVPDMDTAIHFANRLAPEHLELCVKDGESMIPAIHNAGAIFLGNYTPEPLGDYFAGPNHTLPTAGTARFFSPLNTGDFVKKMSVLNYNEAGLKACYKEVARFALAEGLDGHARSLQIRFEKGEQEIL